MMQCLILGHPVRLFTSKRALPNEKIHHNNSQHTFQNSLLKVTYNLPSLLDSLLKSYFG